MEANKNTAGTAYSERIVAAVQMAYELHAGQFRKDGEIPYITHLFGVAALAGEYGGDEDQFIAALLHDAAEDQGGRAVLERIRGEFGARVAAIVDGATDTHDMPKPAWRARKEAHIARIRRAAPEVKLVVAADKLYNMRSTIRDLRLAGPAVWERFTGKREGTLWYYGAMAEALAADWPHPILEDVRGALARMRAASGQPA